MKVMIYTGSSQTEKLKNHDQTLLHVVQVFTVDTVITDISDSKMIWSNLGCPLCMGYQRCEVQNGVCFGAVPLLLQLNSLLVTPIVRVFRTQFRPTYLSGEWPFQVLRPQDSDYYDQQPLDLTEFGFSFRL